MCVCLCVFVRGVVVVVLVWVCAGHVIVFSEPFLPPQAETWDRNYKETGPLEDSEYEHDLFVNLRSKPKPYVGESSEYYNSVNSQ